MLTARQPGAPAYTDNETFLTVQHEYTNVIGTDPHQDGDFIMPILPFTRPWCWEPVSRPKVKLKP